MDADCSLAESPEPARLQAFLDELESRGFEHVGERRWKGPTPRSLIDGGHTQSETMTIVIRPLWPYTSPLLEVPGIAAWHADHERLCLWRGDDTSQEWATVDGVLGRIEYWVDHADDAFEAVENARNPQLYWHEPAVMAALVDIDELIGGADQDGQYGEFSFTGATSADGQRSPALVVDLLPTPFTAGSKLPFGANDHRQLRGRWFFRSHVERPPRNLEEFRSHLTENQVVRLDRDLRDRPWLMYGLVWRNAAGLVCTMVARTIPDAPDGAHILVSLQPKGRVAMLRRAGPDAAVLQAKSVAIIGVGAIGSHVATTLARSGVAKLVLYDHDMSWPVNLIRHAAPPGTPAAERKTDAMKRHLEQYPWIEVVVAEGDGVVFRLEQIRDIVNDVDLTIDATGHGGFAEAIARVAHENERPYVSVALFQGGGIARVRRQAAPTDTPLLVRPRVDGYPTIPALDDEIEYVGTETGCLAQVHNAPPAAVLTAAVLASRVVIDALTERMVEPDEIIEVLHPSEPPFTTLGRLRPSDLPRSIDITESAIETATSAAHSALPNETGGVLVGCLVDGRTVVTQVIEIVDPLASPTEYTVPEGTAEPAVQSATAHDDRLGYVGEWHSHPAGGPPSLTDRAAMIALQNTSGSETPVLVLVDPTGGPDCLTAHVAVHDRLVPADLVPTGDLLTPSLEVPSRNEPATTTSTAEEEHR